MIRSMTGYGRGKFSNNGREYTVEIKTINHRYNDISIKMPRYLNFLEDRLRQYISKSISRGKIDIYVTLNNFSNEGRNIKIDKQLASFYIQEMKSLVDEYGIPNDITATSLMNLPDIISIENDTDENIFWEELRQSTDIALQNIISAREKEGERLANDIKERITKIEENIFQIEKSSNGLLEEYRKKIETRIQELKIDKIIDENRISAEIVLFADKSSIAEELTRLKSHIKSLKEMIEGKTIPIGKKLDFLIQEMNREVNTIGSKANCLEITKYIIDTKNEIENIREQIQNIE